MGLVGEDMAIKLRMVEDITNNFGIDRVIGSGGYGIVYKGLYNGQEIAVKRLRQLQGLDDNAFDNEFRNLCKIRHPNIVGLIGYCHESARKFVPHDGKLITATEMERVLCFEYVEGGTLENHISSDESCRLNWPTCFKIIIGTCKGLHHLHTAQGKPIYHLDLKPENILLDKMMTAKIGDLGLSRLVSSTITHQTEIRKGTRGYMPPEYVLDGAISKKFDVFSLGVIIIKIMAGKNGNYNRTTMPPEKFIELVTTNWKGKLPGSSGHSSPQEIDISQVKTCINIALRCVHANRDERPEVKDIIDELKELEPRVDEMSMYSDQSEDLIGRLQVSTSPVNLMDALDPTVTTPILNKFRALASAVDNLKNKFVQVDTASVKLDNLTKNMDDMAMQLDSLTKKVGAMAEKLNKW